MNKKEKVELTLKEDKCFKITETNKYIYYTCKGISNKIHDIIYFKANEHWKCDCKNIRGVDCYHIMTCKKLLEIEKCV